MTGSELTWRDHLVAVLWAYWFVFRVFACVILAPCLLLLGLTQVL